MPYFHFGVDLPHRLKPIKRCIDHGCCSNAQELLEHQALSHFAIIDGMRCYDMTTTMTSVMRTMKTPTLTIKVDRQRKTATSRCADAALRNGNETPFYQIAAGVT